MFQVLTSFTTGSLTGRKDQIIEINDKKIADMLLKSVIKKYAVDGASLKQLQKQVSELESEKSQLEQEIYKLKEIKVVIPDDNTKLNLGDKTVADLQGTITIDEDNLSGEVKYLANFDEFAKGEKGNFIALYIPEAKADKVVTCEMKGDGSVVKKPVAVDPKDGLIVLQVHNINQTLEIVSEGKTTKTLTLIGLDLKTE